MRSSLFRESYSLTPIQQGMLLHRLAAPGSGFDIEQMIAELREAVDPHALRQAFNGLMSRHPVFRTSFAWEGLPQPLQRAHDGVELPWREEDWSCLDEGERGRRLAEFLEHDRLQGFDPAVAPLARCALFKLSARDWRLVWTFHHMLADGGSYAALIREVFDRYEAARDGRDLSLPEPPAFRDFVEWSERRRAETRAAAEAHWKEMLSGFSAATPLPEPPAPGSASGHAEHSAEIAISAPHGIAMSMLVEAAWALVLARNAGEDDVVFGETRACRNGTVAAAAEIVGLCINTVPVRVKFPSGATVRQFLESVQAQRRAIRPFEHTALTDIQAWSEIASGSPLFHSIVVFTPRLIGNVLREQGGAWADRHVYFLERTNYPLTLFAYPEKKLQLKLAYDRARVADSTAARLLAQLQTALDSLVCQPERELAKVDILPPEERSRLVTKWNDSACAFESERTIHQVFEEQVARTPDATAVVFRDQSLTYRELNARANQLARMLRDLGAGPGSLVGVYLERSIETVTALLAALKSGAAYVPLDPAYPKERLGWVLEDTRAAVILTETSLLSSLPIHPAQIVCLDQSDWSEGKDTANLPAAASVNDLAYVLFTSGSSGRPKGVMIEHRNVMNFFAGMDETLDHRHGGTWLAVTSIAFDISVLELFWTLCRGFKVVLHKQDRQQAAPKRKIDFSLFYFAAQASGSPGNKYRLLLEGAKFADTHGFSAVWTPERHFHEFGGLYPNPALTSAALAAVTSNVKIRAGSVVLPLHNPIRVAEDWSVVDNLSGGRVGLSFASGWHANDFALRPENWANRRDLVFEGIETVRKLWRGESIQVPNGAGEPCQIRMFPPPLQRDPEIWITAATNIDTFRAAGEMGANLLTNLLGQTTADLSRKIEAYRQAFQDSRAKHGRVGSGHITLMLHTFAGADTADVRDQVRQPFLHYLETSTDLIKKARWEFPAFAGKRRTDAGQGAFNDTAELTEEDSAALMEHAFERYFETSGLFGSVDDCVETVERLRNAGVDEIACLIDFGVADDAVLQSLEYLNQVRELSNRDTADHSLAGELRQHRVTHFQCTPSMARMLLAEQDSREALRPLEKLLVGGEALPQSLAGQLTEACSGDLLNMYGPTETTVWSTTARIVKGGEVTLGRPIANTQIYIVDQGMRLAPTGTPGELWIAGAGVARGYLNRPELTAEKFLPNPFSPDVPPQGRVYRTGDLARYRDDGRIEFLRRMDSQVKIRGHRIEMGDIEAAIDRHPGVWESAVAAKADAAGETHLVAYVSARPACAASSARIEEIPENTVGRWAALWEEVYRAPSLDVAWNLNGWNSSYTGEAISEDDMREWVEATVDRVRALRPRRVLEIGCGSGLLLFRLAPDSESYVGVDPSPAAIASLQRETQQRGLDQVVLWQAAAHELTDLEPGSFDLVILNSVVQYFPGVNYLLDVLERTSEAVRRGGAVFIGDVRNLGLLDVFHTSIELERARASLSLNELKQVVERRRNNENELLIDPAFFRAFQSYSSRVGEVRMEVKRGHRHNEMTAFRYDVILKVGDGAAGAEPPAPGTSIEQIAAHLETNPAAARFTGLRNARLAKAVRASELMNTAGSIQTAGELRDAAATPTGDSIEPETLWALHPDYEAEVRWSESGADRMDVVFRRRGAPRLLQTRHPIISGAPPRVSWDRFVNPRRSAMAPAALIEELQRHLKQNLPAYMLPSAYVVLEALPRTPNGKIDWKALPAPEQKRREVTPTALPSTVLERSIAAVWKELLNLEAVGVNDNFFDLGANSLTMVQASSRLRSVLNQPVSLLDLFRYTTVSSLAAHLTSSKTPEPQLQYSEARGRTRLDAALRRMHARQVASEEKGA